jgi:hypothetical protein
MIDFPNQLSEKIEELNETRAKILRKSKFINQNNDTFVYSTEDVQSKDGTEGVTPNDLATTLNSIISKVSLYVNDLKKYPFVESTQENSNIQRLIIDPHPTSAIDETIVANMPAGSILDMIHDAIVDHGFLETTIKTDLLFCESDLSSESGKIHCDIVLTRLNARLNLIDNFNLSMSDYEVKLSRDFINIDDIYIIRATSKSNQRSMNVNLSGTVTIDTTTKTGTVTHSYKFSKASDSFFINKSELVVGKSFAWTAFSINGNIAKFQDTSETIGTTSAGNNVTDSLIPGLEISSVTIGNNTLQILNRGIVLSTSKHTGVFRNTDSTSYDVLENRAFGNQVMMENIVKIDRVLEDSLNDL